MDDETLARTGRYDELWQQLEPHVRAVARRFARGDPHTEDDLVQEAYLWYRATIGRWAPARGTAVRTWVLFCLRRVFITLLRRRRKVTNLPPGLPEPGAEERHRREELGRRIRVALNSLREQAHGDAQRLRQFDVWEDYRLRRWTMEELAAREGTAVATIFKRVHKIDQAVADALRLFGDEDSLFR